jgi:excisionase family DNA binding protein
LEKYYSVTEASKILNVSRVTLYTWKKEGKIKFVKIGERNKISETEIKSMVK